MTQIFIPRKADVVEKRSFEVSTGTIAFGVPVELASTGKIVKATEASQAIGIIDNMPAYRAENETAYVTAGDMATVAMFGITFKSYSGGTFSKGAWLTISAGALINSATATDLLALEASTASGQLVEYLVK